MTLALSHPKLQRNILLAFFASIFLAIGLSLFTASASYADDADAGTGGSTGNGGGDGCTPASWRYADRLSPGDGGHGTSPIIWAGNATGANCSNPVRYGENNNAPQCRGTNAASQWSCMQRGLREVGATGCIRNSENIAFLMYLVDSQPSWATSFYPGGKPLTYKNNINTILKSDKTANWIWNKAPNWVVNAYKRAYSNNTDAKAALVDEIVKDAASALYDKDNVIVCVWRDPDNTCVTRGNRIPTMNLGLPIPTSETWSTFCSTRPPAFKQCTPSKNASYTIPGSDRVKYQVKIKRATQTWGSVEWVTRGGEKDKTYSVADSRNVMIRMQAKGRTVLNPANPQGPWSYTSSNCNSIGDVVSVNVVFTPQTKTCIDANGIPHSWYTGRGTWTGVASPSAGVTWSPSKTRTITKNDTRKWTVRATPRAGYSLEGSVSSWTYTFPNAMPAYDCANPNGVQRTYPFYWAVTLENGGPHPGPTAFETQTTGDYTPLANTLMALSGTTDNCTPGLNKIAQAEQATAVAARPSMDVTGSNNQAMAEGGIMNAVERTTYAAFSIDEKTTHTRDEDGNITSTTTTCTYMLDGFVGEPAVTGFWQALTNHCNANGFNTALAARTGNVNIDNNDAEKYYSGSAVTAKTTTFNPTWGMGSVGEARVTAEDGFFDKQCAFDGVKSASDKQPAQDVVASNWTYFRNNEARDFGLKLFEPVTDGVVEYAGQDALRTLTTRWTEGTPKPIGVEAGELTINTKGGDLVWSSEDKAPYVLTNWNTSETGAGQNWGLLAGQQTLFTAAADWASENGMPTVFQVKWEYDPNVNNTFPQQRVGFGERAGGQSYTVGDLATPIQGWVMGSSTFDDTVASKELKEKMMQVSGSGQTTNTLDGQLLEGLQVDAQNKWTSDPNQYGSGYYYWLKFVRAVNE